MAAFPTWGRGSAAVPSRPRDEPGPQRIVKRSPLGSVLLGILITAMTLATLLAVLQQNAQEVLPPALQSFTLLDTNNALTLLVALLSLVAVRQQYLDTLKPYLSYSRQFGAGSSESGTATWKIVLYNAGTGIAIVERASYRIAFPGEDLKTKRYDLSHDDAVRALEAKGLKRGEDFTLVRFSDGSIIGPAGTATAFLLSPDKADSLHALDLELEFESRSGEHYAKEVFCVPRSGFKEPPTPAAAPATGTTA